MNEKILNTPHDFFDLSEEEEIIIKEWIEINIKPRKTVNKRHTSYGLKHIFQNDELSGGFYMTDWAFKAAMFVCGYRPYDIDARSWMFCISEKSPCFKKLTKSEWLKDRLGVCENDE